MPPSVKSKGTGDLAAVYCIAKSIMDEFMDKSDAEVVDLSDHYSGYDEMMRQAMRIGILFEKWATTHVDFESCDGVWPYEMELRFGPALLDVQGTVKNLAEFGFDTCPIMCDRLGLTYIRPST